MKYTKTEIDDIATDISVMRGSQERRKAIVKLITDLQEEQAKVFSSNALLADSLRLDKCTRLEVINHKDQDKLGRSYVHWKDDSKIEGSLQDGGRTLKLFITKR